MAKITIFLLNNSECGSFEQVSLTLKSNQYIAEKSTFGRFLNALLFIVFVDIFSSKFFQTLDASVAQNVV